MKRAASVAVALVAMAGTAWAQQPEPGEAEVSRQEEGRGDDDSERADAVRPMRKLRVLENPYDIASFYRSDQGRGFLEYGQAAGPSERYPIAGYYRSRHGRRGLGYAPFWTSGYGDSRRRLPIVVGYRRSIGENGDLFLFAPTFLAPIGPLTGAFLGW